MWSVTNDAQMAAIRQIVDSDSDRAIAVLCGAILENQLEIVLKYRLTKHDETVRKTFQPSGPLGPFANKNNMCFLLGVYNDAAWQHVSLIAKIRNLFAHDMAVTDFSIGHTKLEALLAKFTFHRKMKYYPTIFPQAGDHADGPTKIKEPQTPREVFITNVKIMMSYLIYDFRKHRPHSNLVDQGDEWVVCHQHLKLPEAKR